MKITLKSRLRFDVTKRPELADAIIDRLCEIGFTNMLNYAPTHWSARFITTNFSYNSEQITKGDFFTSGNFGRLATLSDLYDSSVKREITIDGKTTTISEQSFQALKQQFRGDES